MPLLRVEVEGGVALVNTDHLQFAFQKQGSENVRLEFNNSWLQLEPLKGVTAVQMMSDIAREGSR